MLSRRMLGSALLGTAALTLWALPLVAAGSPAAPVRSGQFLAVCAWSHRAPDDPIVFPGRPGASHMHDFFGSRATRASTTLRDLRRSPTTCRPAADRSAYWVPTLYLRGRALRAQGAFYYSSAVRRPRTIRPFPSGLRMLAGWPSGRPPGAPRVAEWGCHGSGIPRSEFVLACPAGSRLELNLRFPDCWDGRRTDSPDHRAHMAYSRGGRCPADHPVPVPRLRLRLVFPTRGGPAVKLSSGDGDSLHGDFFNAWEPRALAARIRGCLHRPARCGTGARPPG
jgi:hypothetical protein